MKLLYTVILTVLIFQLVLFNPLEAFSTNNTLTAKNKLVEYYNQELNLLARDTCVQFKNVSEQLLKDKIVQAAATPLMQEFKRNISYFQEIYPYYKRYGLNEKLLLIFSNMIIGFYYRESSAANDSLYILQLLKKFNYDEICDEYESKFMKFITKKLLAKCEEFKNHLTNNQTKQWQQLLKSISELKECNSYACFYEHFNNFHNTILTPKQQFREYISQQLQDIHIFYSINATNIARGVLKNSKLSELNPNLSQQLKCALKEYIKEYESNSDINELYNLIQKFYKNILLKYCFNENIPLSERQLLHKEFAEQGYVQFELNYQKKFNEFVDHGFLKEFDNFKASLSQQELIKEKSMLAWFEHFKHLASYKERVEAFVGLYKFL